MRTEALRHTATSEAAIMGPGMPREHSTAAASMAAEAFMGVAVEADKCQKE